MPPATAMSATRTGALGGALVALGPISMALYTPAMPTLVDVFGTDISAIKLTLTVYFAGFAFAQLLCGPMSDRFGRRPVLTAFLVLYLAGSLLATAATTVGILLVARAIQGVGAAAGVVTARAIVRDLFAGRESASVMNLIGVMLTVGPALSPTIGGLTLDLAGWHAIFLLMVAYGIALLAVVRLVLPETLTVRNRGALEPRRLLGSYAALLSDRRFLGPTLVIGATVGALYSLATMLPFVLIDRVGMTPTQYGIGMLCQTGSYLIGSLVVRRLLGRVDAARLVPAGLVLVAIGAALVAVLLRVAPPSFSTVMGPIGVFAMGLAFLMPALTTAALAPFGKQAGSASAMMGFLQMGGGLVGSAVAASLGDPVHALATVMPAMSALGVVAFLVLCGGRVDLGDAPAREASTSAE